MSDQPKQSPELKDPTAASAEERAAAGQLRRGLEGPQQGQRDALLAHALRLAYNGEPLDEGYHDALLEAMEQDELAGFVPQDFPLNGGTELDDMALAEALRVGSAPGELDPERHEEILAQALGLDAPEQASEQPDNVIAFPGATKPAQRSPLRWVGVAVGLVAAAAVALFFVGPQQSRKAATATAMDTGSTSGQAFATSRSTQALFNKPFAKKGGSSKRIDTIVRSRSRDLRRNRFARWGVNR